MNAGAGPEGKPRLWLWKVGTEAGAVPPNLKVRGGLVLDPLAGAAAAAAAEVLIFSASACSLL